ncbi:MAG TPA: alpha/beta hydrolase [Solirubrobacterales bacterium]
MATTTSVTSELYHEVRGAGPPILFISGASGDAGHFSRAAERLANEFTTVCFDRRGCSRSAPLAEGEAMSIAAQADDAAALVEELGLAPATVFGSSGGGNIALELIARDPGAVRAAIVHEPALISVLPNAEKEGLSELLEIAVRNPREAMELFVREHTSDETFEALDPTHRERILGNGAHFFGAEIEAFGTYLPDLERVRAAGVPIRVFAGDDGSMEKPGSEWLAAQLGLAVEPASGHHAPYLQDPEHFAEELRPILREVSS